MNTDPKIIINAKATGVCGYHFSTAETEVFAEDKNQGFNKAKYVPPCLQFFLHYA
jgi:hypothetical protein